MKGYYKNPEATAEAITPDGWLHTGDIVRMNSDGRIWITDRKKELIKFKGFQVPPAELEGILLEHPNVADACVIGKPDDEHIENRFIKAKFHIADAFDDEVNAEAQALTAQDTHALSSERTDLTHLPFVTIDSANTRDIDDSTIIRHAPESSFERRIDDRLE